MRTLYLTDNGLMLKKVSNRIAVKKNNKIIEEFHIENLKRVLVFGNSQISTQLMRHLSERGIEVSFLSAGGRFHFRLVPDTSKNIYLRMAQHRKYDTPAFRQEWGRTVVGAKLKNQRNVLMRFRKNQPGADIGKAIDTLEKSRGRLQKKATLDEIMGVEGYASKVYFSAYGRCLLNDFEFVKRKYHPPPDPVNALLSFGYMLLFNEFSSLLEATGFDIFLGFLHSTQYGRASLATDMMEELRSPVVDRLVSYLINLGVVKPDDFMVKENKGVRMNEKALKAYLTNYEKYMTASFKNEADREYITYRRVIQANVLQLEKVLLDNAKYEPFSFYA